MGYCIDWRNVCMFSSYLMGFDELKGTCRKTKDTRSIIARVACTFFCSKLA